LSWSIKTSFSLRTLPPVTSSVSCLIVTYSLHIIDSSVQFYTQIFHPWVNFSLHRPHSVGAYIYMGNIRGGHNSSPWLRFGLDMTIQKPLVSLPPAWQRLDYMLDNRVGEVAAASRR
jgi:hypothetical protein